MQHKNRLLLLLLVLLAFFTCFYLFRNYLIYDQIVNGSYDQRLIRLAQTADDDSKRLQELRLIVLSKNDIRLFPFTLRLIKKHENTLFKNISSFYRDKDKRIRLGLCILGQLWKDARLLPALEELAGDKDEDVQKAAVEGLGRQDTKNARAILKTIFLDRGRSEDLRYRALTSYLSSTKEIDTDVINKGLPDRAFTTKTLQALTDTSKAIPQGLRQSVIKVFKSTDDEGIKSLCFEVLARIHAADMLDDAFKALSKETSGEGAYIYIKTYRDEAEGYILKNLNPLGDSLLNVRLIRLACDLRLKSAVPVLLDKEWANGRHFREVIHALGILKAGEAVPIFKRLGNSDNLSNAILACRSWANLRDPDVIPYLKGLINKASKIEDREEVYKALASLCYFEAFKACIPALENKGLSQGIVSELKAQDEGIDSVISLCWSGIKKDTKPLLYPVLSSHKSIWGKNLLLDDYRRATKGRDKDLLRNALISFKGDKDIAKVFLNELADTGNNEDRDVLLKALSEGEFPQAREEILKGLKETKGDVRASLIRYFKDDKDEKLKPILFELLPFDDLKTIRASLEVLYQLGNASDLPRLDEFKKVFAKSTKASRIYEWDENTLFLIDKIDSLIERSSRDWAKR